MRNKMFSMTVSRLFFLWPILSPAFLFSLNVPLSVPAFSIVLSAEESCFVNRDDPDTVYNSTTMQLRDCSEKSGYSNLVTCPLIQFDLSALPDDAVVQFADLVLTVFEDGNSSVAYESSAVYCVSSAWDETTVTWNNQPSYNSASAATIPRREVGVNTPFFGEKIEVDITELVQGWYDGTILNAGVFLAMDSGSEWGRYRFYSDEAVAENYRPTLVITYLKDLTVPVVQDSYVFKGDATNRYGDSSGLNLWDVSAYSAYSNTIREVLIQPDFSALPFAAVIENAELNLTVNSANHDQSAVEVFRCEEFWGESSVCWTNRPQLSDTVYAIKPSCSAPVSGRVDSYDITDLVEEWRYGVCSDYGLCLRFETNTLWGTLSYCSREWAEYAPEVRVTYSVNSFDVKDYGATGDGVTDDTSAICSAVLAADSSLFPAEVFFPEGVYCISGTNGYALSLQDLSDVCLNGEGTNSVLLVLDPENGGVSVEDSLHVRIQNLLVDYDPVPFTQGTITAVDTVNGTFDLQVDSGFQGLDADCFASAPQLWGITVDLNTPVYGLYAYFASNWMNLGADTWRMIADDPGYLQTYPLSVGDRYVHQARQYSAYAVGCFSCTNVQLENVMVCASAGLATGWVNCDGVVLDGLHVGKRDGVRLLSANGDGAHISGCSDGVLVENCIFEGMSDDAVTIHGRGGMVIENYSDTVKKVGTPRPPTVYAVGDQIQVYKYQGPSGILTNATIVAAEQLASTVWKITLDRPVPNLSASWSTGDRIYNLSRCGADALVNNNVFGRHRGRDLLLRSFDVDVVNNSFYNQSGWAVALHHEDDESTGPASCNVDIVDNQFFGVPSGGITASIDITSFGESTYDTTNVLVEGNTFAGVKNEAVKALCVSGLTLRDNVVSNAISFERASKPIVRLGNADNVSVDGLDVYDLHSETYAAIHIHSDVASGEVAITNLVTDMNSGSVDVRDDR